jgi:hypothetical protein
MLLRELPFEAGPAQERGARHALALLLRAASRALDGLAARLALVAAAPAAEPLLEFHAEAGAPEGALFVNGQFVGHLPGVNRL